MESNDRLIDHFKTFEFSTGFIYDHKHPIEQSASIYMRDQKKEIERLKESLESETKWAAHYNDENIRLTGALKKYGIPEKEDVLGIADVPHSPPEGHTVIKTDQEIKLILPGEESDTMNIQDQIDQCIDYKKTLDELNRLHPATCISMPVSDVIAECNQAIRDLQAIRGLIDGLKVDRDLTKRINRDQAANIRDKNDRLDYLRNGIQEIIDSDIDVAKEIAVELLKWKSKGQRRDLGYSPVEPDLKSQYPTGRPLND